MHILPLSFMFADFASDLLNTRQEGLVPAADYHYLYVIKAALFTFIVKILATKTLFIRI